MITKEQLKVYFEDEQADYRAMVLRIQNEEFAPDIPRETADAMRKWAATDSGVGSAICSITAMRALYTPVEEEPILFEELDTVNLPYDFDLHFDIKTLGQAFRVLKGEPDCSDGNPDDVYEMLVQHNLPVPEWYIPSKRVQPIAWLDGAGGYLTQEPPLEERSRYTPAYPASLATAPEGIQLVVVQKGGNGRKTRYIIIADPHLGHNRMVELGYRPADFEEKLLKNLAAMVRPGDVIIVLGDVSFYRDDYWHRRLLAAAPGCLYWLLLGNHDKRTISWYLERGWHLVAEQLILEVYGLRIAFSHRPIVKNGDFDVNFHGHLHDKPELEFEGKTEKHRLVYMEHDYMPFNLRTLLNR